MVLVCWSAVALAADLATDVPDPKADDFYRTLLMNSSDHEVVDQINQHYGNYQALARVIGFVWRIQGHMCGRFHRAGYFSHAKACYEERIAAAAAAPLTHAAYWEVLKKGGGGTNIAGRWTSDAVYRTNVQQLAASGHMGLAVISLDFGDYAAVVREAELARAMLRQSAYASDTIVGFPGVGIFAVGYSAAATASEQQGNLAGAREYAALCRNLTLHSDAPFGRDTANDRKAQNTSCASAAVSAQEPAVAMEWINKSTSDVLSFFMRASMAVTTLGFSEVTSLGKQLTDPWDASAIFLRARLCEQANDAACAVRLYDLLLSDPEWRTLTQYRQPPLLKLRPNLHYRVLFQRALLALQQGEAERGMQMLVQAIDVIESMRTNIDSETARIGFAGDKQAVYAALVSHLMKTGRHEQAFAYAERAKARALVDLLAQKMNFKGTTADGAPIATLLETQARNELRTPVLDKAGQDKVRGLVRLPEVHQAIAVVAPELASLVAVESIDVKLLQRLLPAGETLVEYYGDGSALFAFVLTAQGVIGYQLDGRGLNQLVAAFRTELATPRSAAWSEAGEALYQRLIAPIRPAIQGAQLTLVPHGPLHYLPFAALPVGNATLMDTYAIRMLPSASVLKFLKRRGATPSGDLLALGNPDLNDAAADLPGAQLEVEKITAGRANSRLLVRQAATETAVRELGGGFRNVHLASHGVFNPERPLDSALVLAPDARNDGRLTVSELYELQLHADLVTLSACETALGKVASGDELVGLTRGFLYAGASSIVSSLWQVDDEATMLLMETFYQQLQQGADKRIALRSAQQALIRTGKAHPFYWAAFQLTGSAQNVLKYDKENQ